MKGKYIRPVGVAFAILLVAIARAGAQSWTATSAPTTNWRAIACSADGSKLVAAVLGGGIYISADSGSNWTASTPTNGYYWVSVASSSDGTKLLAASGFSMPGLIYTSTNSGANWTSNNAPQLAWQSVASSADGTRLVAVAASIFGESLPNGIFLSTNSGSNWSAAGTVNLGSMDVIASSADGSVLLAGSITSVSGNRVLKSLDSGTTWSSNNLPSGVWEAMSCSTDGIKLVAAAYTLGIHGANPGVIYASADSGTSWGPTGAPTNNWVAIASSADGSRLVAAATVPAPGRIYTSADSGANWTWIGFPGTNGYAVAISADGSKQFVAVHGGGIYALQPAPSLRLSLAPSGSNLVVSWSELSANYVLQENFDLTTTNWTDVTNALTVSNFQYQVILPLPAASTFYRLKQP